MLGTAPRPKSIAVARYEHIVLHPLSGTIGAEIRGVDLSAATPGQLDDIRRALADHLVIVFRDQHRLTRDDHVRFAQTFGKLQPIPHLESRPGFDDVQIIHRDADDQRPVTGELFHSDSTYMTTPPTVVVMRAITLPPFGGDTAFANLQLAYETLSPSMREMLDRLKVVHSAKRLYGTGVDQSRFAMKKMNTADGDREVVHPLVVTHPISGRKSIFINPAYSLRIHGMTDAESSPLLDFLYRHCTFIPLTFRVRWEPGTVVAWDNWGAYHSAIGDYQGYARTLERVTLGGPTPT